MDRVVLLGASNLTWGIATVVETARKAVGAPVDVLAAMGNGRSYGAWSSVLGRGLPGIRECGLWERLGERPPGAVRALLTDVGNDIAYGHSPEEIAGWVETCLERLEAAGAATVITLLPLETLEALSPLRFAVVRTVLFPGRAIGRHAAISRSRDLDGRLREIAARRGASAVEVRKEWFGPDGIHIRLACWPRAWGEILAPWGPGKPDSAKPFSLLRWGELLGLRAERWTLFGIPRHRRQPCRILADGTRISTY